MHRHSSAVFPVSGDRVYYFDILNIPRKEFIWQLIINNSREMNEIDEQIKKLKELLELQMEVKDNIVYLTFIGVEDLVEMTGWGRNTVNKLFDEPDFPCCDFGKEKKAEIHAVLQYFSKPHRKTA